MIRFVHIFNNIDNHGELQIITQSMSLEYTLHRIEDLKELRKNLDDVIQKVEEVEELDSEERMDKWLNGGLE